MTTPEAIQLERIANQLSNNYIDISSLILTFISVIVGGVVTLLIGLFSEAKIRKKEVGIALNCILEELEQNKIIVDQINSYFIANKKNSIDYFPNSQITFNRFKLYEWDQFKRHILGNNKIEYEMLKKIFYDIYVLDLCLQKSSKVILNHEHYIQLENDIERCIIYLKKKLNLNFLNCQI